MAASGTGMENGGGGGGGDGFGWPVPPGVSCWTAARLAEDLSEAELGRAWAAVDQLGARSAAAQGIKRPMTSSAKLAETDHRLYVLGSPDGAQPVGFVKVGGKHLFYYDAAGGLVELDPLCVLDFYVDEACQRQGFGGQLLDAMLEREGVPAQALAWDNPSPSSFGLIAKRFGLRHFVPQPNRFVIFDEYFK